MSSAQEAETGAGFVTARELVPARITLEELGHAQGPTPLQFDNQCAKGILTDEIKQKCSKAMDMRFYWLRDRIRQGQFKIFWKYGVFNDGDYVTKHHPTKHHIAVRSKYVANSTTNLTDTSTKTPNRILRRYTNSKYLTDTSTKTPNRILRRYENSKYLNKYKGEIRVERKAFNATYKFLKKYDSKDLSSARVCSKPTGYVPVIRSIP